MMFSENLDLLKEYEILTESPTSEEIFHFVIRKTVGSEHFYDSLDNEGKRFLDSISNKLGDGLDEIIKNFGLMFPEFMKNSEISSSVITTYINGVERKLVNDKKFVDNMEKTYMLSNNEILTLSSLLVKYYTKLGKLNEKYCKKLF